MTAQEDHVKSMVLAMTTRVLRTMTMVTTSMTMLLLLLLSLLLLVRRLPAFRLGISS